MTVESSIHLADMAVLTLYDEAGELAESRQFDTGSALEVAMVDPAGDSQSVIFKGEITALETHWADGLQHVVRARV